jgi:hypothetical protein
MAHCAIETGTSEQGAKSVLTYPLHSFLSRGVSALMSTPGIVTSKTGVEGSFDTSPPDCPWHVELDAYDKRSRNPAVT